MVSRFDSKQIALICDLYLPAEMTDREIKVRRSDLGILSSICDARGGTTDGEDRHRLRDEARACQLTTSKLFYRPLSPLGFKHLFTTANRNRTLN